MAPDSSPLWALRSSFSERPSDDRTFGCPRQLFAPIIIAANKARQARDSLPTWVWEAVPDVIQKPVDEIFAAVEAYERFVGALAARTATEPHIERTV